MTSEAYPLSEFKQQAIDWLVRLRADDLADAEMQAFAEWLAEDGRHAEAFAFAEDLFDDMVSATNMSAYPLAVAAATGRAGQSTAKPSHESSQRKQKPAGRHFNLPAAALAMAAVWLFALFFIVPESAHPLATLVSDYHTDTGELRSLQLADGSELLLNTNSSVSIDYDDTRRQIVLHHGQVRFTVAKDSKRPFEVKVDELQVRALGTVFEVYRRHEQDIIVTVQKHAVSVGFAGEFGELGDSLTAQAGQRLRFLSNGEEPILERVDLEQTAAWQQRRFVINDRPLGELIAELNRYRVGRIFLSDAQLNNLRVTGVFSLENPDDILSAVNQVLGLHQTRLGPLWTLLHR